MKYSIMFLFLSAGISTAADDAESKKLLKDLEGSYKVTAAEMLGNAAATGPFGWFEKVSIKGDKFSLTLKGADGKSDTKVATITVDATKKPAHIDLKADEGRKKGETALGIISIEGDTIKICVSDAAAKNRPAEFKTSKDDSNMFLTLKKSKE